MNKHCFSKTKDKKSATWVTYCALTKLFKQCFLLKQFHLQLSLKVMPKEKYIFWSLTFSCTSTNTKKGLLHFLKGVAYDNISSSKGLQSDRIFLKHPVILVWLETGIGLEQKFLQLGIRLGEVVVHYHWNNKIHSPHWKC